MPSTRVVVMGGLRIVQAKEGDVWNDLKMDKAGELKAGIYNLGGAKLPTPDTSTIGYIIHVTTGSAYQQDAASKQFIKHDIAAFDTPPKPKQCYQINYERDITHATKKKVTLAVQKDNTLGR